MRKYDADAQRAHNDLIEIAVKFREAREKHRKVLWDIGAEIYAEEVSDNLDAAISEIAALPDLEAIKEQPGLFEQVKQIIGDFDTFTRGGI